MPVLHNTREARQQMEEIVAWLRGEPGIIPPGIREIQAGTTLFRMTRAQDEEHARQILGARPAFFATTEAGANQYRAFANLGARGRLVLIKGVLKRDIQVARANQAEIVGAIYLGKRMADGAKIGPFRALQLDPPGSDELEDTETLRIQRYVVPSVVSKVLNINFAGLLSIDSVEVTIANPLSLQLDFNWLEN